MAQASFLLMPLEIRNHIYSYIYACEYACPIDLIGPRLFHTDQYPDDITLEVLLVNRQISEEAAAIFYSKTKFRGDVDEILCFIKGIGAAKANLLSQIQLYTSRDFLKPDPLREVLSLKGLRVLDLVSYDSEKTLEYFDGAAESFKGKLIKASIMDLTGRVDVEARLINNKETHDWNEVFLWKCKKGDTEWTEERRQMPLDLYCEHEFRSD